MCALVLVAVVVIVLIKIFKSDVLVVEPCMMDGWMDARSTTNLSSKPCAWSGVCFCGAWKSSRGVLVSG